MKLLEVNPRKRLGYNGAEEIKQHPYFEGIDFNRVFAKAYNPPFVPELNNELDLRYFDPGFTTEEVESFKENIIEPNKQTEIEFQGFTYQPEDLIVEEEKNEGVLNEEIKEDFEDGNIHERPSIEVQIEEQNENTEEEKVNNSKDANQEKGKDNLDPNK